MKAYAVVSLLWFRRRQNRPAVVSHPHEEGAHLWFIFLRPVLSSPSNCKSSIFDVLISLYQFITKCRLASIVFYFLIKKKKKFPLLKGNRRFSFIGGHGLSVILADWSEESVGIFLKTRNSSLGPSSPIFPMEIHCKHDPFAAMHSKCMRL